MTDQTTAPAGVVSSTELGKKPDANEYVGVRCMCLETGCRAAPGCPHYSQHCKAHIAHESQR